MAASRRRSASPDDRGRHAAVHLPGLDIDRYSLPLPDPEGEGFLGDRASQTAFRSLIDRAREHHLDGRDPFGRTPSRQLGKDEIDLVLVGGNPDAAHALHLAAPAFAPQDGQPFSVHTRWIETEFENSIRPYGGVPGSVDEEEDQRQRVVVEVNGKRLEVLVPHLGGGPAPAQAKPSKSRGSRRSRSGSAPKAGGDDLTSPMQGTIVKVAVKDGAKVQEGDLIVVMEAMKMEQPLTAHKSGKVTGLKAKPGDTVSAGAVVATIK